MPKILGLGKAGLFTVHLDPVLLYRMKGPVITLLLRLHDDVERAGLFFGYFLASIQQGRLTGLRIANAS